VGEKIGAMAKTELLDLSVDVTVTEGQIYQACNANTTTDTCNWTEAACHSIWGTWIVKPVYGYKRRTCTAPTSEAGVNMPNSPQRPDGYYTRGMMDFAIPLANGNYVNCDGTCDVGYTLGSPPALEGNGALLPWPTS
jgi:hypothetical protein